MNGKPRYVVIQPKTASYTDGGQVYERTQLPIKLAFAITIHKSQEMTLDKAQIKLAKRESPVGLTFVAFSRVRQLNDLLIDYQSLPT
jgi:ATP-dependent exoDNAse (exonuclease V) alpha subunit